MANRYGRVKWGPGQERKRTKTWNDPPKWNRQAEKEGVRKKVFCASLADWLDEEIPAQWREDLFDLIESCKSIDWLMLTKRPQNARDFLPPAWWENPLPNVWFGVTAENQKYWDLRVPLLAMIPAALHWVSYEPSLGPLHFRSCHCDSAFVDWLIIGGESAQNEPAREFKIEWAESCLAQASGYGMIPFVKQLGSNATWRGQTFATKDKAGTDPSEWPEALRVRHFPVSPAEVTS
jgi:protein gp37